MVEVKFYPANQCVCLQLILAIAYLIIPSNINGADEEMKLRLFLLPFLAPVWLLGFALVLLGENKRNNMCLHSAKLALTKHRDEPIHLLIEEQELLPSSLEEK